MEEKKREMEQDLGTGQNLITEQNVVQDLAIEEGEDAKASGVKRKGAIKRTKRDSSKKDTSEKGISEKDTSKNEDKKKDFKNEESFDRLSIEEAFEKLNGIIGSLDKEGISLEDSFRLYQEGVRLLQYCNAKVDMVEKQMMVLNGSEERDEF